MMNLKRLLALVLTLCLTAGVVFAAEADPEGMGSPPSEFGGGQRGGGGFPGMDGGGSYSHGAEETVEAPIDDIPEGYAVNPDTQGDPFDGEYGKLFDTETVQDVHISISENNWNYMLQNAIDKPQVLADSFQIGQETVEYVGIKTKGNLTLRSVWSSDSDRFSFTINVGKYVKAKNYGVTQNFYGLRKFALNNIYGDSSLMKEYLSYELMNAMGIPTPYYCLVNLHINGEFWGVYMMIESIDEEIVNRTLGESGGFLTKPESPGGDLVYNYDTLDAIMNEDGSYAVDLSTYGQASNPITAYSGIWEEKESGVDITDYDPDDAAEVAEIKQEISDVLQWMRTLNDLSGSDNPNTAAYQAALEEIMDVDTLLRYFAANVYLVNLDSYLSQMMQNYVFYLKDGYMQVIPWDYNFSFGNFGISTGEQMVNYDVTNPLQSVSMDDRPLLNALLQNDEYRQRYYDYLADCAIIASVGGTTTDGDNWEEDHFTGRIRQFEALLTESYAADPTAFYTVEQYQAATEALIALNTLRAQAVLQQVAGDMSTVACDINMRTLGESTGGGMSGMGGGGFPQTNGVTFTDVSGSDWFYSAVAMVSRIGLMEGVGEDRFAPLEQVSRGQFLTILGRLGGVDAEEYGESAFADVEESEYYSPYAAWASRTGLTAGLYETTLEPGAAITRQEMAYLIAGYLEWAGVTAEAAQGDVFSDAGQIADWALDSVLQVQTAGIMVGDDNGNFNPQSTATRAETAAVAARIFELTAITMDLPGQGGGFPERGQGGGPPQGLDGPGQMGARPEAGGDMPGTAEGQPQPPENG